VPEIVSGPPPTLTDSAANKLASGSDATGAEFDGAEPQALASVALTANEHGPKYLQHTRARMARFDMQEHMPRQLAW
jgi:hypothetical protein